MMWPLQQSHSQVESAVHSARLTVLGVMRMPGPVGATLFVRSSGDGSRGSVSTQRNECCEAGRVRAVAQTARVPTSPSGDAVKGSLTVAVLPKHRQEVSGGIGFTWRNEDR